MHAASMAAFFVDQLVQAPAAVQCAPVASPDPLLARLIFAAIPSIFALGIAWLVVVWNGGREQKQWIRDQKKAEWSQLLRSVAEVQRVLRFGAENVMVSAELIESSLKAAVRELSIAQANCILLRGSFEKAETSQKFFSFLNDADGALGQISAGLYLVREAIGEDEKADKLGGLKLILNSMSQLTSQYGLLLQCLQEEAAKDLMT